jgi:SAM-dependent methyltransferase
MDVTQLDFEPDVFDVICSFETLEHVRDAAAAIREAARVLRPAGVYVVSTPRVDETSSSPENPFHQKEYSSGDFATLLGRSFGSVELYGQRRLRTRRHELLQRLDVFGLRRRSAFLRRASAFTGTRPTAEVTLEDVVIEPDALDRASEIIAVCRAPR